MANIEVEGGFGPDEADSGKSGMSLRGIVNVAGALTSLALVAGIGVWGYNLLVRDVSGVPVVRALEGPMRVPPADPGGEPADYQGLAVNAVAAQGTASPTADRVMLAPKPVSLTDEDVPMQKTEEPVMAAAAATPPREEVMSSSIAALVSELTRESETMSGDEELPVVGAQEVAARIEQPEPLTDTEQATDETLRPDPTAAGAPGLQHSIRPQSRPARVVLASAPADGSAPAPATGATAANAAGLDVDPDSLAVGTRLAQLGAYDTPEIAKAEWDKLYSRFADYMDGKQRVIQEASSGGRTFYRLRATGFDDLSDARRFCSALVAENADCIPVTLR